MNYIRKLQESDVDALAMIATNAFPGSGISEEDVDERKNFFNIIKYLDDNDLYGYFEGDQLIGGIRLVNYIMNFRSELTNLGGIGTVCVDLLHKKEKIAKELIVYALNHFKEKGTNIVALYPFRADFYKKMGFGYVTQVKQYKLTPSCFSNSFSKEHLVYVNIEEKDGVLACYERYMKKRHGMIKKIGPDIHKLFLHSNRIVAFKKNNEFNGYINFTFKNNGTHKDTLVINEFIYETKEALKELCTFINTQSDQFDKVIITTQDEEFHHILNKLPNENYIELYDEHPVISTAAVGMMCRITDVRGLLCELKNHNFGGQNCKVKICISDNLIATNNCSMILHFIEGIASITEIEDFDVEFSIDISEFSSLIFGNVDFRTLVDYGLINLSDINYVYILDKLFACSQKPICTTYL